MEAIELELEGRTGNTQSKVKFSDAGAPQRAGPGDSLVGSSEARAPKRVLQSIGSTVLLAQRMTQDRFGSLNSMTLNVSSKSLLGLQVREQIGSSML